MDLLNKTKELCQAYNIKPARSKGQNFLIREEVYDKIVAAAEIKADENVLEVGPGLGFLTAKLAKKAKQVTAVELDDKLAEALQVGLESQEVSNVEVLNMNILDLNTKSEILNPKQIRNSKFENQNYKIVANLPYNITSVFLRKFLEAENKPELMVLMLQKEVAERIVAKAGDMSLLAVSVQFYAEAEIVEYVPKEDFWPQPEVDSAVIKLKVESRKYKVNEKEFFRLVKFGFSSKRKMLKNNLAGSYHISQKEAEERIVKAGFSPKVRAQELSVADWMKLFGEF